MQKAKGPFKILRDKNCLLLLHKEAYIEDVTLHACIVALLGDIHILLRGKLSTLLYSTATLLSTVQLNLFSHVRSPELTCVAYPWCYFSMVLYSSSAIDNVRWME
jgi:hypothetical protein